VLTQQALVNEVGASGSIWLICQLRQVAAVIRENGKEGI
jgi:hypothetical protein